MYPFSEIRKTLIAAVGLLSTGIAYVLADENLRNIFPPQWVAIAGAVLSVLGVFVTPNKPAPSVAEKAVASLQDVQKQVAAINQTAVEGLVQVREVAGSLHGSLVERAINTHRR